MNKYLVFLSLLFLWMVPGAGAATTTTVTEPPRLDGTYEGELNLVDDNDPRTIGLSTVFVLTDQVETIETSPGVVETMKVIDGNFLVGKEGGPFAFTKIRYRLNTSEIDMSYKRTKGVTVGQPASFRLVGKVKADGSITGIVLSSFKGQIGTFKLAKTSPKPLVSTPEYVGIWYGLVKLVPEGEYERFGISIAPTGFATENPDQLEFDYSLGKIGHMDYSIAQMGLPHVVIDYLHRRISLSNNDDASGLTVNARLDPKTHHLIGFFASRYGGLRGDFDLPPFDGPDSKR